MAKVVFLGAGSAVFTRNLVGDILSLPELRDDTEFALMDIDAERLRTAEIVTSRLIDAHGARASVEATTDRRAALDGADYVVTSFQVGGYKPSTVVDFEVPKRYGLRQTIADTLGIGGIMRGLRTIPVLLDICRDLEELSPDALLLNYVNPMAMLCWAAAEASPIRTVGLCHSVQGTTAELARDLGIPAGEIDQLAAGINHMAFFLRFEHDGADLYPALRELEPPELNRVRYEVLQHFGYFVTESSEHFSEYVPWFIKDGRADLIERFNVPLDEYPRRCERQIEQWEAMRGELELSTAQSHEYGAHIIRACETGEAYAFNGNVPNTWEGRLLIDNLPADCCVEVPCVAGAQGIEPQPVGTLPRQLAALMQTNVNVQGLTVEAALTGRREAIHQAAALDPHTAAELSLDEIHSLVDELLEAHGDWIPALGESVEAAPVTGEEKMRREGLPEEAIAVFRSLCAQLAAGVSGTLRDADLRPVEQLPVLADVPRPPAFPALARACVVKLNGGLGTSMGITRAKALLEAREGLTFLDVIARQVEGLRSRHDVRLPLVLMHSFRTQADSLAALAGMPDVLDFLQHRVPKLRAVDLLPVTWPADPSLEWCPPGHGDLYAALRASGLLRQLLDEGIRYAFVSNADNLGAVLDPAVLEWFAASGAPLMMETVIGNEADRKGGHIAWRGSRLVLRETAQAESAASFGDFRRWRHYNTNNVWLDLEALAALDAPPALPLIVNHKTVDPTDPASPAVVHTETAMGAALEVFDGARALCVPRSRFVPVKTTDDLLALRSDVYRLHDDGRVEAVAEPPFIALDSTFYRRIDDFAARFPAGPPSLRGCERFVVRGDVTFGADVTLLNRVEIQVDEPTEIPDGAVLDDAAALGVELEPAP